MHLLNTPARAVQITGPADAIDKLLTLPIMAGAPRFDRQGKAWVELAEVDRAQVAAAGSLGCQVHIRG